MSSAATAVDSQPEQKAATTSTSSVSDSTTTAAASKDTAANTEAEEAVEQQQQKSSYYFFKSTPASEAHKYAPKPIERGTTPVLDSTPQPIAPGSNGSSAKSASAWNTAGTFEERDVTEYAHDLFRKHLVGTALLPSDSSVQITKVGKCDGESTIIWSRGKKKVGYDLHVRMTWSNKQDGDAALSGSIEIPELADFNDLDELELKWSAKTESEAAKDLARKLSKQSKAVILKKIQGFVDELKAH